MAKEKKFILIVEDDTAMRNALVDKFEKNGFKAVGASDGEEGLQAVSKEKPDLIILDILMPKMDGITMTKKVREEPWGKDLPIIMLTNLSDPDSVSEVAAYGVFDFLVKTDWRLGDVVKLVKKKLGMEENI